MLGLHIGILTMYPQKLVHKSVPALASLSRALYCTRTDMLCLYPLPRVAAFALELSSAHRGLLKNPKNIQKSGCSEKCVVDSGYAVSGWFSRIVVIVFV